MVFNAWWSCMLDGLACLMVLHGLLKVTGVQRNPGVGGLARQTWRTRSSMRLDALAEVAFCQVQVSFQILRRSQFRHVPGSKHSKRFFSKSFDSSRNFETTWPYSTRSCSVSWSSTFLNTGRKTTSYTFFHLSTWYHFVAVTVVIGHPTGPLQYFTSHYFALQKKLYSRAF